MPKKKIIGIEKKKREILILKEGDGRNLSWRERNKGKIASKNRREKR